MKISREELLNLLHLVEITKAEEIDCEEFLCLVSGYVEKLVSGDLEPEGYDDLLHHLKACPECLEELEALYGALGDDS